MAEVEITDGTAVVLRLRRQLKTWLADSSADPLRCLDLLQCLSRVSITVPLLQKTKIGRTLTVVSKQCQHPQVLHVASQLLRNWKQLATQQALARASRASTPLRGAAKANAHTLHTPQSEATKATPGTELTPTSTPTPTPAKLSSRAQTGVGLRDRVRQRLLDALGPPPGLGTGRACGEELAVRMEQAMFDMFAGTNDKYKAKFRDLSFNLKDSQNTELNVGLYRGTTTPEAIVSGRAADLASQELQAQRRTMQKEDADANRSDWNKGKGAVDTFRCGKCKKRKCTYYQQQTRSADEPMTTFVTCLNCNNRWKC